MPSPKNKKTVLITVSGPDRTGVIAKLTSIVADGGLAILDMEQVVVQGLLSLSIVLEFPDGETGGVPVLKDLLFAAKELGLDLDFKVLPPEEETKNQPNTKSVMTLIGHDQITAAALSHITKVLAENDFNIETIRRLDQASIHSLELVVSSPDPKGPRNLKNQLLPIGRKFEVDIALQPDTFFRRLKRLVVFDLDSTLIQAEIIDELAKEAGVADQVREITNQAMNGEIEFHESLQTRVALLKGLPEESLAKVYRQLPFTPGAEQLIRILQRMGYRTAVISGGFEYFTERIKTRLGLDYAYGNQLETIDGKLSGRVSGKIIDGERKAEILEEIAKMENIHLDQVIAIGDGANDLPMLNKAGLGVAFNAKPSVSEAAEHSLTQNNLDAILFLLGISQNDIATFGSKD